MPSRRTLNLPAVGATSWCFVAPPSDTTIGSSLHPSRGAAPGADGRAERKSGVLTTWGPVKHPWWVGGMLGLGAVGAATFSVAPAQAAPVEFPDWATVTGTVPDDSGFDRAAADANNWTFSWSTNADGVVTFVYADGRTSSSATPGAPARSTDTADPGLTVQSTPTALWTSTSPGESPAAVTDPGMGDLAAVAAAPFGGELPAVSAPQTPSPAAPPAEPPASAAQSPASNAVSDAVLVDTAHQGLGGAYVWGGTDYMAWDCSGFTQWVYAQNGITIPRVTWDQFAAATPTATPQPGDLVSQNGGSHVGIYLGGDQMISALNPQEGTVVHSIHAMPVDGFYTYR
ncbi:C40 family peptidase [Kocuria sp.]|uniref:C40 family peptidase n=1 Tax=Kocuria sp. TaxID=1871328 RepID=UPI0026E0A3FC|nr:C40 family peptidase [Kocuria sp.]MDO5619520.1 NlpC/P60 family protein [Kocuria sp.]